MKEQKLVNNDRTILEQHANLKCVCLVIRSKKCVIVREIFLHERCKKEDACSLVYDVSKVV